MRGKKTKGWFAALLLVFSVSCVPHSPNNVYQGYIEGEYVFIASGVAGTLLELDVKRGQKVKAGEKLYQLELKPQTDNLNEANAALLQAQAQLIFAKLQLQRRKALYERKVEDKSTVDEAQAEYDSRLQQINIEQNKIYQAKWALDEKTKTAPLDSRVFDIYYRVGEKVKADQPVLALLSPEYVKALFYLPQEKLSQIKIGQMIYFTCDGCNDKISAKVSYISPEAEFTPPVIYSKDTRSKLMYLIRADLSKTQAENLHPGQPIDVTLYE